MLISKDIANLYTESLVCRDVESVLNYDIKKLLGQRLK